MYKQIETVQQKSVFLALLSMNKIQCQYQWLNIHENQTLHNHYMGLDKFMPRADCSRTLLENALNYVKIACGHDRNIQQWVSEGLSLMPILKQ